MEEETRSVYLGVGHTAIAEKEAKKRGIKIPKDYFLPEELIDELKKAIPRLKGWQNQSDQTKTREFLTKELGKILQKINTTIEESEKELIKLTTEYYLKSGEKFYD